MCCEKEYARLFDAGVSLQQALGEMPPTFVLGSGGLQLHGQIKILMEKAAGAEETFREARTAYEIASRQHGG